MPVALTAIIVAVAVLAVGYALGFRTQMTRTARQNASDLEQLAQALKDVRGDVEDLQRELGQLKTATEVGPIPIPPLPRARSGGLDDLREQLRAAHRESEPTSED